MSEDIEFNFNVQRPVSSLDRCYVVMSRTDAQNIERAAVCAFRGLHDEAEQWRAASGYAGLGE